VLRNLRRLLVVAAVCAVVAPLAILLVPADASVLGGSFQWRSEGAIVSGTGAGSGMRVTLSCPGARLCVGVTTDGRVAVKPGK
jgi:O-antigen ligase